LTKDTVTKPVCHGGKKPLLDVVSGAGQPVLIISRPSSLMWTFPGSGGEVTETLMKPPVSTAGVTVIGIDEGEGVVLEPLEEPVVLEFAVLDPLEEPVVLEFAVLDPLEEPVVLGSLSADPAQPASR